MESMEHIKNLKYDYICIIVIRSRFLEFYSMEFTELKPEEIDRAANMLKAISHPMRLAILGYLGEGKELSVTEIHKLLQIEQSTASHHLGILKDKGILVSERQGKNTHYYLKRKNLSKLVSCISQCACTD